MHRQLRNYSSVSSTSSQSTCDDSPESGILAASSSALPPITSTTYWRQHSVDSVRSYCSELDDDDATSLASSQVLDEHEAATRTTADSTDSSSATPQRSARALGGVPTTIREHEQHVYPNHAMQRTRSLPVTRSNAAAHGTSALPSPSSADAAAFAAAGAGAIAACSSAVLPSAHPGFGQSQSWTPGQAAPAPYTLIEPLSAEQQLRERQADQPGDRLPTGQPQQQPTSTSPSHSRSPPQDTRRSDSDGRTVVGADRRTASSLEDSSWFPPLALAANSPWWAAAVLHTSDRHGQIVSGGGGPLTGVGLDIDACARAPPPSRAPSLQRQRGVYDERTSRALSLPPAARRRMQEQMAAELRQREAQYAQEQQQQQQQQPQLSASLSAPDHSLSLMRGPSVPFSVSDLAVLGSGPLDSAAQAEHDSNCDELPPLG